MMNYELLARELQKLGYNVPAEMKINPEKAREYVESFVQEIEKERSSGRFEKIVQEQNKTKEE